MSNNVPHLYADAGAAAAGCADYILETLRHAVEDRGRATLAVSGGTTPKLMFEHMRRARFPWDKLEWYFVDERSVPPESDQSNYRLANENFLAPAGFPRQNIHRIDGEIEPKQAAQLYSETIREKFGLAPGEMPVFDVIHHGMGADGHTASLFPHEPLIDDRGGIAGAVFVKKLKSDRITLLPGVLLAARHNLFLVAGEDKREALHEVLAGPLDVKLYPSQIIARSGKRVEWFVGGVAGFDWPA